jgi:hypothetical protein
MQSDKMLAGRTNQMKEEKTKQLKEWKMADEQNDERGKCPTEDNDEGRVCIILVIQC